MRILTERIIVNSVHSGVVSWDGLLREKCFIAVNTCWNTTDGFEYTDYHNHVTYFVIKQINL